MNVPVLVKHSAWAPSAAKRWMECAASVRDSRLVPPAPSSPYAQKGTSVARVGELCLKNGKTLEQFIGQTIEGVVFDAEDVEPMRAYVEHVEKLSAGQNAIVITEARLDAGAIWRGLYGHADSVVVDPPDLHVVDLKYGEGVFVDHISNPQLLIYGLAALLEYDLKGTIERVHMTIVQPRYQGADPIRTYTMAATALWRWAYHALLPALRATEDPNARYVPGDHCRWCPARPTCKALARYAQSDVQNDFTKVSELTGGDIAVILQRAETVMGWVEAVRVEALARAQRGEDIPGYVLGTGRSVREWVLPEKDLLKKLLALGLPKLEAFETKLRSPAQIEKRLPKAKHTELAELIVSKPGGAKLVRDDGRVPTPTRVAEDFTPSFLS